MPNSISYLQSDSNQIYTPKDPIGGLQRRGTEHSVATSETGLLISEETIRNARESGARPQGQTNIVTINGVDERLPVENTTAYPWRMICHLETRYRNDIVSEGTGWLADAQTVITAAHCLHDTKYGGWAERVIVRPGRHRGEPPFGYQISGKFGAPESWIANQDRNSDIAFIRLAKPFENDPGHFGFAALPNEELFEKPINIAGYPYDFPQEMRTHRDCALSLYRPGRIEYELDTEKGQSGAPIFMFPHGADKPPVVVGVHAYGVEANYPVNSGARITEEVFRLFDSWCL